jgi:hypothetical protein
MRLNPFDEALLACFKTTLRRWIESITLEGITPKFIHLDTHYMYDMVNDMVEILEVINKMESISFLQDNATSTFIVVSTTHTTKEVPIVWKCLDWKVLSKHNVQCKGHSKGGGVPLRLGIV